MIRRLFVLIVICLMACNLPAAGNKKAPATRRTKAAKAKPAPKVKDVKVSVGTCESLRMAVEDLIKTFGSQYPDGKKYLACLRVLQARMQKDAESAALQEEFLTLQRQALTANPLLDFDRMLLVKRELGNKARSAAGGALGLPTLNARTNDTIRNPGTGWNDSVVEMSDLDGDCVLRTVYKGVHGRIVCDMDLHFDGRRIMFSSGNEQDEWNLYEYTEGAPRAVQLTPKDTPDVSYYDSCYLPDGRIATTSTACYQGLPCQNGNQPMASLYLLDRGADRIRQLTFEQDSDWCPTVLNDGRLMYLRWEYTDAPHYFTRVLFTCNPDGTGQLAYYGSNSYFPNAFFYARPIPDHPTMVIGIVGGHHGVARAGRLLIIDPAKSRFEADGVVQEIPGRGKVVKPLIIDRLVDGVWPQFLHPYPLSEKYHLVSMKKTPMSLWGVYLVDMFDNLVLLKELENAALLEPIPYRKTAAPPVIPDRIDMRATDALVYIADIYHGPGLKGVPRGKVRNLRLFSYHYAHVNSGGHASVGVESSWDVKRVLGTVPVEEDGSAFFAVPANTPISLQPLDEKGRALQLMRSWLVGMPGEMVSCVGCHENPSTVPPSKPTIAALRQALRISDWYGPRRPFSFVHEVQPVLTKYCSSCHNGQPRDDGKMIADFSGKIKMPENVTEKDKKFHTTGYRKDVSYMSLQPYVRRPGPESNYHLNKPMEYHASTSELIQMLEKGHHNVKLDDEAWARLFTWIDLNAPHRGSWSPAEWRGHDQQARRLELAKAYANIDTDPEREYALLEAAAKTRKPCRPVVPEPLAGYHGPSLRLAGWPLTAEQAAAKQQAAGKAVIESITLGEEAPKPVELKFVMIPAGEFVMGSADGDLDERPLHVTLIDKPFAMSTTEITNRMYRLFDPTHDSGVIDRAGKDHKDPGEPANRSEQPVIRVTWQEAMAFCRWLGRKTGANVTLPTEAQWEWACRAGTDTAMWYGAAEANFAGLANFADSSISGKVNPMPKSRFRDGVKFTVSTGFGTPNAWGLLDMHGNVAEWTRTDYRPYPYDEHDGRNELSPSTKKVVRGGSWRDRPQRGRSAFRLAYETWQPVLNVGFRVVIEGKPRNIAEIDNAEPAVASAVSGQP